MNRRCFLAFGISFLLAAPGFTAEKPLWLVVTAPAYRNAIEPLCQHRRNQGFDVEVLQTSDVLNAREIIRSEVAKLQERIRKLIRQANRPTYLVLVGAVEPAGLPEPERKALPALRGTINRMKNHPTDHGYGDVDADHVCQAALGRLPARSEAEAQAMVRKIIDFESDTSPGEWRRRITVLAGVPEFNPLVDTLVERLALAKLERIDPAWSGRAIYHNSASRFTLPDRELNRRALDYVQAGQALTLYLGHSGPGGFWAGGHHYLDREDWAKLKIPAGQGIFATFGCLGCQLQGKEGEGYGLAAIRNPQGPVAVIGSHGICFAAMVQLAADGLFEAMLARQTPERLGDVWLAIQKHLATAPLNPISFSLLDAVDGDSTIPPAVQRREHLEMFLLLGDPALRLPVLASDLRLQVEGPIEPGKTVGIHGEAPKRLEGATVQLTVERPLTSPPADLEPLPKQPGADRDRILLANHDRANRFVLVSSAVRVRAGRFQVTVKLPDALPWSQLLLRAYAVTDRDEATGFQRLEVTK